MVASATDTRTINHPSRDPEKIVYLRDTACSALIWWQHSSYLAASPTGPDADLDRRMIAAVERDATTDPILAALVDVLRPHITADEISPVRDWEMAQAARDAHNMLDPLPVWTPLDQPNTCSHGVPFSADCKDCEI